MMIQRNVWLRNHWNWHKLLGCLNISLLGNILFNAREQSGEGVRVEQLGDKEKRIIADLAAKEAAELKAKEAAQVQAAPKK
jgi:hypothetical protein